MGCYVSFIFFCREITFPVGERKVQCGQRHNLPIKMKCDVHFWTFLVKNILRDLDRIQIRIMRIIRQWKSGIFMLYVVLSNTCTDSFILLQTKKSETEVKLLLSTILSISCFMGMMTIMKHMTMIIFNSNQYCILSVQ